MRTVDFSAEGHLGELGKMHEAEGRGVPGRRRSRRRRLRGPGAGTAGDGGRLEAGRRRPGPGSPQLGRAWLLPPCSGESGQEAIGS